MLIPLINCVDLSHKVILVTGATAGIGKALAARFCQLGATVILLGRNARKLEAIREAIAQQLSTKAANLSLYPLNLQGANDVDFMQLAETLRENFGRLDVLLHNAGILGNLSPMKHYSAVQWYKVMQTNLNAPFMLTQACYSLLESSPQARVIFTSTGVAQKTYAYWGAYAISKRASDFMMQQLAQDEQDTALSFCSFNPGAVATAMRAQAFPGENPQAITQVAEIVPYYLSLIVTDSRMIDGKVLHKADFTH